MKRLITHVYELPADEAARKRFLDGVERLQAECSVKRPSSSANDEISYADLLSTELEEHIGDFAVERIRQDFERAAREGATSAE